MLYFVMFKRNLLLNFRSENLICEYINTQSRYLILIKNGNIIKSWNSRSLKEKWILRLASFLRYPLQYARAIERDLWRRSSGKRERMGAAVSARRGVKIRKDSGGRGGVELCKIYSREIVPREWLRPSRFRTRLTSHERRRKSAGRQCYPRDATRDEGAVGIDNRTTGKIPMENAREARIPMLPRGRYR